MDDNKKIIAYAEETNDSNSNLDSQKLFISLLPNNAPFDLTHSSKYIMKLDKSTMEIKFIEKEELMNGKVDLESLIHPYFTNLQKNGKKINNSPQILNIEKNDKILLFSPHPDDEILGACGLLYKSFIEGTLIKVVYMTSGKGAGDANVRKVEASNGIKKLGGNQENLLFTTFPFYEKKDRSVTEEDYKFAKDIINADNPSKVFICADIFDPNRTHKKCFDILLKVLEEKEFDNIEVYFYYSVWYWPEEFEYSHILPYDYETYKMKIYAMLEHKSQIENKFMGNDPRPFYQRATARDTSFGKMYNHDYCEVYFRHNKI